MEPLIGAIAAGNAVVIKPSELAPASSSLLANALPNYLDTQAIKVIEGGPAVGQQLLHHKWDKIFFTGIYQCISVTSLGSLFVKDPFRFSLTTLMVAKEKGHTLQVQ